MILYKKYQMAGGNNKSKGLWYIRPVINQMLDIEALAKHMSDHNTPYSPGVIKGVLTDMVSCIKELILDGKNVKLDDRNRSVIKHTKQHRYQEAPMHLKKYNLID